MIHKRYLILDNDSVWLEPTDNGWQLPGALRLAAEVSSAQWLLTHDETQLFHLDLPDTHPLATHLSLFSLRECAAFLEPETFKTLSKAKQLLEWQQTHRFCGRCGQTTVAADHGKSRQCPACKFSAYPRISPCVMVAIYQPQQRQLLLARSFHFRPQLYSVLAGFIEAGESAEECARREVYEEVGLTIGRLSYFGSQPWPFPHQLMLAYSAEYAGGQLRLDADEIEDAQWFSVDRLPPLPEPYTLSHQLIQHVLATQFKG